MTYMPLIQQGFSYTLFTTKKCFSDKVSKHQNTKCDSVPSKCLEIMFLNVSHQEFDRDNGNYKCHYHSHDQDHHLCSGEMRNRISRIFRRLAPNMTGIPRKKVNSAATVREVPTRIPPIMVEPERDVPGTNGEYLKQTNDECRLKLTDFPDLYRLVFFSCYNFLQ